jgi:thioredoxin family protein
VKTSTWIGLGALVITLGSWFPVVSAQETAGQMYNRILRESEDDYYNCAKGIRNKDARKQAYIEHGQRSAKLWEGFLREHGATRMAFEARLNLAQALDMAKEADRAGKVLDEAVAEAISLMQIKRAAAVAKIVSHSTEAGYKVIEKSLNKLDDPESKAELYLELIKFIDVPPELRKKRKEAAVYRKKKHEALAAEVAKKYPATRSGTIAAKMVRGCNLKVGDPAISLEEFLDETRKPLDMKAYKDKVVLIHFWTGRSASRAYLTRLVELHQNLQPRGLEVIGVNCDYEEDKERNMDRMVTDLSIPWRNYHDGEKLHNQVAMVFYVRKYPYNIVVGRDGKIAAVDVKSGDLAVTLSDLVDGK